ncbi:MAG: DUF2240 family protein [Candidatus Nanohaloarchaeota archaeon QJJ-9]|nr:DUF2240 family protein [Candidatus Nanohaloarchaeota archaeon QJJ-9]
MVEEIIEKIAEETELDKEEVKEKVDEKSEEFSGLVSEEGAAHLVAREHGVTVDKDVNKELKVENIVPGMNRLNIKAKVADISEINTFERDEGEEGQVQNMVLGDDTGTVRMTLWDEQTKVAKKVDEGDVIQISNAYSKEDNQGRAEIRIGDDTQIKRVEEDDIGEIKQKSSGGSGNYKEAKIDEVIDTNAYYSVTGEVIDIYGENPFYQVCPDCGETLKKDNDYKCGEHGEVEPEYRIALTAVIDDGLGSLRCVFFQDRAKKLLDAEGVEFKGNSRKLQDHAEKALGKRVRVKGRTQENDYIGNVELIVNEMRKLDLDNEIESKLGELQNV